jgi:hypothetical protein
VQIPSRVARSLEPADSSPDPSDLRLIWYPLTRFDFVPDLRVLVEIPWRFARSLAYTDPNTDPSELRLFWHPLVVREPLLVDAFEVTRGEWLASLAHGRSDLPDVARAAFDAWPQETVKWPASFMTRAEARAYAQWRGMRLLSFEEWMVCALGPNVNKYPWDISSQRSAANTLDLNLRPARPTAVGTFEYGRSWRDCYDLLGNVYEWVDGRGPNDTESDGRAWTLGGSYLSWAMPIFDKGEFFGQKLDPESRFADVGLRCAIEARTFLARRGAELLRGEDSRRRLIAVGRHWGAAAVPLLRELAAQGDLRDVAAPLLAGAIE